MATSLETSIFGTYFDIEEPLACGRGELGAE
jgi:hypothetical protein